jgi:SAM-dependent methyltransferase
MPTEAPYDEIADWYENEFLARQRSGAHDHPFADRLGIDESLATLLGPGSGLCLEVGCGTGIYADRVRSLGYTPAGIDLSSGMLSFAASRLPAIRGDATALPFADESIPTAITVMAHTDMPEYASVLRDIHRVLAPGGTLVHVGVHPCFCGGFADRTNPMTGVLIKPGYLDGQWTTDSWTDQGIRDKVGASHFPLAELLNMVGDIGFSIERFLEGGEPTPITFSFRATKD